MMDHGGEDALALAQPQRAILWVKSFEHRLEKDYVDVTLTLPSCGADLKRAAVAVLAPHSGTVRLDDIKLYVVHSAEAAGEPPLSAEESSALQHFYPPSRRIECGMDGKHFLISGLSGELELIIADSFLEVSDVWNFPIPTHQSIFLLQTLAPRPSRPRQHVGSTDFRQLMWDILNMSIVSFLTLQVVQSAVMNTFPLNGIGINRSR
jgi:hypothetical protein